MTLRLPFKALFKQRGGLIFGHNSKSPSPSLRALGPFPEPCTAAPVRALSHRHCCPHHQPLPPLPHAHARALAQRRPHCSALLAPAVSSGSVLMIDRECSEQRTFQLHWAYQLSRPILEGIEIGLSRHRGRWSAFSLVTLQQDLYFSGGSSRLRCSS